MSQLNQTFAEEAGAQGWDYRAGPDLWKNAPPFEYQAPGPMQALEMHLLSLLSLLAWLVLAFGLARRSALRVRVV